MIVVFPDHTHLLLGLVTKMPPCSNKVKPFLNVLWNQKTIKATNPIYGINLLNSPDYLGLGMHIRWEVVQC